MEIAIQQQHSRRKKKTNMWNEQQTISVYDCHRCSNHWVDYYPWQQNNKMNR